MQIHFPYLKCHRLYIGSSWTYRFSKCQKWQILTTEMKDGWSKRGQMLLPNNNSLDLLLLDRELRLTIIWKSRVVWGGAEVGGKWIFTQRDKRDTPIVLFSCGSDTFFGPSKCLSSDGSEYLKSKILVWCPKWIQPNCIECSEAEYPFRVVLATFPNSPRTLRATTWLGSVKSRHAPLWSDTD